MKKPLSVLFVTTKLYYNGAKKYSVEVANEFAKRGHKVGLIYDQGPLVKKISDEVIKYPINLPGLGLDPLSRLRFIIRAALISRTEGYDIIHSESSSSIISHKLLSFFSRAKIVETIHQVWTKPHDRKKAAKRLPGRADALISISPGVKIVMKEAGLDLTKVVVIQNGIDTKEFGKVNKHEVRNLRISLGIADKDPVLVWVSRISREKKPESFVDWFPYILADFPNVRLVMVGDNGIGDRKYLDQLILKIKKLGLSKHIICVGGKTDVQKYLALGDIFTITGRARDLSVMEAMASGLPVVVTKLGYPFKPELVVHGKTGLIFDWNNWRQWANYIKYLLSKPNVVKEFGKAGKERVNSIFNIEGYVDKLEKLYGSLLEG